MQSQEALAVRRNNRGSFILHRSAYVAGALLGAVIVWWASTSIFTGLTKSWLHLVFPLVLLALVLLSNLPLRTPGRVRMLLGLASVASIVLWSVRAEFVASGVGLFLLVAFLLAFRKAYEKNPRALLFRLVAISLGSGVALVMGEVAARAIGRNEYHRIPKGSEPVSSTHYRRMGVTPEWAQYTGTANQAGSILVAESQEYKNEIEFNAKGLRGPLIEYDKPGNTYRLMLLGDSFIEAIQVQYNQTIQAQLESLIKERRLLGGRKVEVFGVGTAMWGTIHQYMYYRHEGYRYKPDLVVLVFIENDVQNNMPANTVPGTEHTGRNRRLGGEFVLEKDDIVLTDYHEQVSEIVRLAAQRTLEGMPAMVTSRSSVWWVLYTLIAHPFVVDAVRTDEGVVVMPEQAWDRTATILRMLKARVDESGARLVIASVLYPRRNRTGVDEDKDGQVRHMKQITTGLHIPWLNLRPAYEEYVSAGHSVQPDLFGKIDAHWSANGHRVTGEILLNWLVQGRLLRRLQ